MDPFDNTPIDSQVCINCGKSFDIIDPDTFNTHTGGFDEIRCTDCQTAFRIASARQMHISGRFITYASLKYSMKNDDDLTYFPQ